MPTPLTIDDPRWVRAVAHPLRIRILAILQERSANPKQLAEWLDASLGVVSYHVRTLHGLGVIELVDETRVRGAIAHHYRARERPKVTNEAWSRASPMAKQAAADAALQMIHDLASHSAAAGGFDGEKAHLSRTSMRLDARAYAQLSDACAKLLDKAHKLERESAQRIKAKGHADVVDTGLVLLLFEASRVSDSTGAADDGHARRRR